MGQAEKLTSPPFSPIWQQDQPNSTIDFGICDAEIAFEDRVEAMPLQAQLSFGSRPNLSFQYNGDSCPSELLDSFRGEKPNRYNLTLGNGGVPFPAFLTHLHWGTRGVKFVLSPSTSEVPRLRLKMGIARGIAHLLNSPSMFSKSHDYMRVHGESDSQGYARSGRVVIDVEGVKCTFLNVEEEKERLKLLESSGGYQITGVCQIERLDGTNFSEDEFEKILVKLHWMLSFAFGKWSGLCLPVGFDKSGERVYESWGTRHVSPGVRSVSQSWFFNEEGDALAELATGFFKLMDADVWKDELHNVLWWYLAANNRCSTITVDMAIIHAHAALELLAWLFCVRDKGMLSDDAFKPGKLIASDKLRLIAKSLRVPTDIPVELDALGGLCPKPFTNGPHAIAELRNDTIHPKKKRSYDSEVWFDGLQLALWQIELMLLSLCGYEGRYQNRLKRGFLSYNDVVPWAADRS